MNKSKYSSTVLLSFTLIVMIVGALVIANVFFVMVFGYHVRSRTNINNYTEIVVNEETIYARRGYMFDRNGNITKTWNAADKVFMGTSDPTCRGNISSLLQYKGFFFFF